MSESREIKVGSTYQNRADQAERSGVGHKCLTDDIAKIIRDNKC